MRSEQIQWLGSGSRAQNFVHVSDVVDAALLAAETDNPGVYNVGGTETTTMQDLARLVVAQQVRVEVQARPPLLGETIQRKDTDGR